MAKISELPLAGPLTGAETMPIVQNGEMAQAPFSDVLASIGDAGDQAILEIAAAADTKIDLVNAAGDAKIALASGEADRAALERAIGQQAAIDAQTAALALGGPPSVSISGPSAFFGQESADQLSTQAFLTLPAGALTAPKGGTDWMLGLWFTTGGQHKQASHETVLSKGGPNATGGNDRSVWISDRGTSGGIQLNWLLKQLTIQWMANAVPAIGSLGVMEPATTYFLLMAQVANRPYLAYCAVGQPGSRISDTAIRKFVGDANHGIGSFWWGAKATGTYTIVRNANVITVSRTSGAHNVLVGDPVWINGDEDTTGFMAVCSSVVSATVFTCASPGANMSYTNPGYARHNTIGTLFEVVGAVQTGTSGNNFTMAGAVQGLMFRRGAANVPGDLASSLISGGAIDTTALQNLANRRFANLPGTDLYSHSLGDLALPATGANSTTAPTATGTVMAASPLHQPEYLRLDPRPHEWPHAAELGARTGSIRLTGTSNLATRSIWATIYADQALTTVVEARHVCAYPGTDGTFSAETRKVPLGKGYWVVLDNGDNSNVKVVTGPHEVGKAYGILSQSTLNYLFAYGSVAPVAAAVGTMSVLDVSGGLSDSPTVNYTNQASQCRATALRIRATGQAGNGITAAGNKLASLFNAELGRAMPLGFVNLCTSGHAADIYIHDRKTRRNGIGNLAAGVAANGTWYPVASPNWTIGRAILTLAGSARLYVNGMLAATTDASGNWIGQGIAGTFNFATGAYSVTSSFAGVAEIEATMHYNTAGGSEARKTDSTLTCFGNEAVSGVTGHVLERLLAAKRFGGLTAIVFSWENYRVNFLPGLSDADAAAHTAYIMSQLRARIAAILGKDVPWIVMGDPRTTSFSDANEHRARKLTRAWALAQANTFYIPAPLMVTMDAATSPHAGSDSDGSLHMGEVMAHGIAMVEGVAGAASEEIMPIAVTRVNASTVDITISRSVGFTAAQLATGLGGEPDGIYFGTTATGLLRIDPAAIADNAEALGGYTISFPAGTTHVVRVAKDAGNIPSGWWNINWGAPFNKGSITLTTLAAQATAMDNSLFLNTGGFTDAARPGISVQPAPDAIYCA